MLSPNNSFKPNLLRSGKNMAEEACHVFTSTTQVGLTQALEPMRYLKVLGNNLVCWATATLIAAVVVSFSWSTVAALQADSISRFAEIFFFGVVIAFFSLCFGLSFALILVAPLHSFLVAHGRTSLGWAVAIALLPACIKWATQSENLITLGFMVYGATAGFLAHWLRVKDFFGLGSNNSFKPKPLRGSA